MKYWKIINLWVNEANQLSKFNRKNYVEINDHLHGVYSTGS